MKHNRTTLKKLEAIYEVIGYRVRYEKGTFASGHCIVRDKKIVLINKFFDVEGRIQKLTDLLSEMDIDDHLLDSKQKKFISHLIEEQLESDV